MSPKEIVMLCVAYSLGGVSVWAAHQASIMAQPAFGGMSTFCLVGSVFFAAASVWDD